MVNISEELVARLIHDQVPQWRHLPVRKVIPGGWENRIFRLGERMLVGVPRAEEYIQQIPKERTWLPRFTPLLSVPIPTLLFVGEPGHGYPWLSTRCYRFWLACCR